MLLVVSRYPQPRGPWDLYMCYLRVRGGGIKVAAGRASEFHMKLHCTWAAANVVDESRAGGPWGWLTRATPAFGARGDMEHGGWVRGVFEAGLS